MKREKILFLLRLLKCGDIRSLLGLITFRLYSEEICLGFSKTINTAENLAPKSAICRTENMHQERLLSIIDMVEKQYGQNKYFERRKRLVKYKIGSCYVSFIDSVPCHFQWVFNSEDNDKLAFYFKNEYPRLNENEAILEHALTLTPYRGIGIHKAARQQIMEMERKNNGIKRFISFINPSNTPSIKTAIGQGFIPYLIRREIWFLFGRRFVYERLSEDRFRFLMKC